MAVPRAYYNFNNMVLSFGLISESVTTNEKGKRVLGSKTITYQKFKITSFTARRMTIQVQFDDPTQISKS